MASNKQQLTLFDFPQKQESTLGTASKRRRVEEAQDAPDTSISDDSGTESECEDEAAAAAAAAEMTAEKGNQYITVNKPLAPTTIVMTATTVAAPSMGSTHGVTQQEVLPPSDIASGPHQSPVQPIISFPARSFGGKGRPRAFNSEWYSSYSWLEYSVERDAAFCYPCRLFELRGTRSEKIFTRIGFRDWKHAKGKSGTLTAHNVCSTHKQAMCGWSSYTKNFEGHSSIVHRLETAREKTIKSNRYYIKSLAEILLLCARQELAIRGHKESNDSQNKGNFL